MRNCIVTSILIFFVIGCGSKVQKQEIALIPIDRMKVVVWQLMKTDEYYTKASSADSALIRNHKNVQYYQQIFDYNKIDRVQFYKQMDYLERHPVEFKVLMDSVNELSKREKK